MSARIFVLCLLSSIISTAAPLKCQTCFASKEECKNENMELVECGPDEGHCLTLTYHSSMLLPTLFFTFKACATANQCSEEYYDMTSVGGKYEQMRITCCENDGCNTGTLPIRGRDLLKPNGFTCPGSYEQNGHSEESGPIVCLGDQDQCFIASGSIRALSAYHSVLSAQGCTTKNFCAYPMGETEQANGLLRFYAEKIECWDPERLEGWNGFSKTFGWGGN